ncbi:MAG TPA: hypothetical protein VD995_29970 [Azospirillum sp.]|nr:hypothetical protein [Azospirillum sp.]
MSIGTDASPSPSLALRGTWTVPRGQLMAGLYLVGLINGLAPDVGAAITKYGVLMAAANLFGVTVIELLASALAVRLALRGSTAPPSRADLGVGAFFLILMALPSPQVSWMAIGMLAAFDLLRNRAPESSRAAATVMLALSVHEVWSRVAVNLLAMPLTNLEAAAVAFTLGLMRDGVMLNGNLVDTPDGFGLAVVAGCLSMHYISAGLVCWVAITQAARPAWKARDLMTAALVVLAMFVLNHARLVGMGFGPDAYHALHSDLGAQILGLVTLAVAALIAVRGVRHELGRHELGDAR